MLKRPSRNFLTYWLKSTAVLSFFLLSTCLSLKSQTELDSLYRVIHSENSSDTSRLDAYKELVIKHFIYQDADSAFKICNDALTIAKQSGLKTYEATFLNIQGVSLDSRGLKKEGFIYFQKSLEIRQSIGDSMGVCKSLINLGMAYLDLNEIDAAMESSQRALKIAYEFNERKIQADILSNIAIIYQTQGKLEHALDYFEQGHEMYKSLNYPYSVAIALTNMGITYRQMGQVEKALAHHKAGLKIRKENNLDFELANSYSNLAAVYHLNLNELDSAEYYASMALDISNELGDPYKIVAPASTLQKIYEERGDYKKSLKMLKLTHKMADSLKNQQLQKEVFTERARAEFEREILMEQNRRKEEKRQEMEADSRRNTLQYSALLIGLVILFVILIVMNRLNFSIALTEGLIFFVFLLFFEFLLLLFDPYIEQWTNKAPAYMFALNSLIALIIFPLHNFIEKFARSKIVGKNN